MHGLGKEFIVVALTDQYVAVAYKTWIVKEKKGKLFLYVSEHHYRYVSEVIRLILNPDAAPRINRIHFPLMTF